MQILVNLLNTILSADDTVLRTENESDPQKFFNVFDNVSKSWDESRQKQGDGVSMEKNWSDWFLLSL